MSKTSFNIVVLKGDGIGPEVAAEGARILECLSANSGLTFTLAHHDFGGIAIDNHENPLPDSTLDACKTADAILLGELRRADGRTILFRLTPVALTQARSADPSGALTRLSVPNSAC